MLGEFELASRLEFVDARTAPEPAPDPMIAAVEAEVCPAPLALGPAFAFALTASAPKS